MAKLTKENLMFFFYYICTAFMSKTLISSAQYDKLVMYDL